METRQSDRSDPKSGWNIRAARVKVMPESGRPTILNRPIQQLYSLEVRGTSDNHDTREPPEDTEVDEVSDGVRRDALPETEQSRRLCRQASQQARNKVKELAALNLV